MADTDDLSLMLQADLRPRLSSTAEVFLHASDEFANSNLRFTEYERPVSRRLSQFKAP